MNNTHPGITAASQIKASPYRVRMIIADDEQHHKGSAAMAIVLIVSYLINYTLIAMFLMWAFMEMK